MPVISQHPAQIRRGQEAGVQVIPVFDHQLIQRVRRLLVFFSIQQSKGNGPHILALAVRGDFTAVRAGKTEGFLRVFGDVRKARGVLGLSQDFSDPGQQGSGTEVIGRRHVRHALHHVFPHFLRHHMARLQPFSPMEARVDQEFFPGVRFVPGPGLLRAVFAEGQPAGHHPIVFF